MKPYSIFVLVSRHVHGPHNHLIPLYSMFTKVDELPKKIRVTMVIYMKPPTYRNSGIMSPLSAYNFSFLFLLIILLLFPVLLPIQLSQEHIDIYPSV